MKTDQVEQFGSSLIQHGPANNRAYLMKLSRDDCPQIIAYLHGLAILHGYSKIFAKVPGSAREDFERNGYSIEAEIPRFYNGQETGLFMARYFRAERTTDNDALRVQQVLEVADDRAAQKHASQLPEECKARLATPVDCEQMANLYQQVFASYPFPIDNPDYLVKTMEDNLIYAGIWHEKQLLALASAEIDFAGENAELTDFATAPEWRGHGFAHYLLQLLEEEMQKAAINSCYTIARATSFGMNIVFAQHGYQYSGTLVNNTQISGGLESMNVWHKRLAASDR